MLHSPYEFTVDVRKSSEEADQDRHPEPAWLSVACAWSSVCAVAGMLWLVEHAETTNHVFGRISLTRVALPLALAAVLATLAVLTAVRTFSESDLSPLFWLLPLGWLLVAFTWIFDWYGLLAFGKPRPMWYSRFGWLLLYSTPLLGYILMLPGMQVLEEKFEQKKARRDCRELANRIAEFQTEADEIVPHSAEFKSLPTLNL